MEIITLLSKSYSQFESNLMDNDLSLMPEVLRTGESSTGTTRAPIVMKGLVTMVTMTFMSLVLHALSSRTLSAMGFNCYTQNLRLSIYLTITD